jgi:hypothetical protein
MALPADVDGNRSVSQKFFLQISRPVRGFQRVLGFWEVNPVFGKSTYPLAVFVSEFICAVFAAEFAGDRLDLREEFVFAPSFGVHSVLCAE